MFGDLEVMNDPDKSSVPLWGQRPAWNEFTGQ